MIRTYIVFIYMVEIPRCLVKAVKDDISASFFHLIASHCITHKKSTNILIISFMTTHQKKMHGAHWVTGVREPALFII